MFSWLKAGSGSHQGRDSWSLTWVWGTHTHTYTQPRITWTEVSMVTQFKRKPTFVHSKNICIYCLGCHYLYWLVYILNSGHLQRSWGVSIAVWDIDTHSYGSHVLSSFCLQGTVHTSPDSRFTTATMRGAVTPVSEVRKLRLKKFK